MGKGEMIQGQRVHSQHRAWKALARPGRHTEDWTLVYTEDLQHGRRFGDLVVENPFL